MRRLGLIFALALGVLTVVAMPVGAEEPETETVAQRHGLMWNRSGLPLVFPLQVKTLPGRDYFMILVNVETDAEVLAAYIRGGRFFRVLTPPGTFRIWFAHGVTWQGEAGLFGPQGQTGVMSVPEPLVFGTQGLARKAGHIIDLTQGALQDDRAIIVEARLDCQRLQVERFARPLPPRYEDPFFATRLGEEGELLRHPAAGFDPVRDVFHDLEVRPKDYGPVFSTPRIEVEQAPC